MGKFVVQACLQRKLPRDVLFLTLGISCRANVGPVPGQCSQSEMKATNKPMISKRSARVLSNSQVPLSHNATGECRRPRKTRVAAAFPEEAMKETCSQSHVLREPLTPIQAQVIGNISIGSSQPWAMSPNFSSLIEAFSAGAQNCHRIIASEGQENQIVSIAD